jgi:uncharacterized protein
VIVFDVNVFLFAFDRSTSHHELASQTLVQALTGTEPVGVIDETLTATVRISTNPRITSRPATTAQAIAFCERVRSAPMAEPAPIGTAAWPRFASLAASLQLRGNDITDAWLAARAIELRAQFITFDKGFERFPDLRVTVLGAPAPR